jgi:hypothetical protein
MVAMKAAVWMSEPLAALLLPHVPKTNPVVVRSSKEFFELASDPTTVAFVDTEALALIAAASHLSISAYVIALCPDQLVGAVDWLRDYPFLTSVVSVGLLTHPMLDRHLENVIRTATSKGTPRLLDWLGSDVVGRRVRLTHASRRAARIDRMATFFESQNVGTRTLQDIRDAVEELVTNAFYDAPVAAGAIKGPVSRAQDVSLPDDNACDLAYGFHDDIAVVRVRDPFGALSRRRLIEVLTRCSQTDVQVDETMGGAGLGMWRIFSRATFVAISVVKHRHTEILVGLAKRAPGARPFAIHLFFRESKKKRFWQIFSDDTSAKPGINHSVMIKPK